ncbi:MAG: hypothetical protein IJA88_05695 [Clostridia bacterium]|nr:hypothetical protein [Clostridia bacterium]
MLKKTFKVLISIVLVLAIILLGAVGYFKLPVNEYYKNSEKAFVIPELDSGYVPQGFCFDITQNTFLATGYMKDGSASPVFAVDKDSGNTVRKVLLKNQDGTNYTGHAGGIAFWKNYLYVADGGEHAIYVFDYEQFKNADYGEELLCIGTFSTETANGDYIKPSCVEVKDNSLIIGEFYREPQYNTHDSHKITTPNGDKNTALAVVFNLEDSLTDTFGINPTPVVAFSMREQVQGMTFDGSKVYLSTSWGLSFSHIYVYDIEKAQTESATVLETTVPLAYLDRSCLVKDIKVPPMSEEMAIVDGKLYINCESASTKYIFGKFTGGKWCYATDLSKYGL